MGLFDKIKKKVVGKDVFDTIKKVKKARKELNQLSKINSSFQSKQSDNTERATNIEANSIDQQYNKLSADDGQLIQKKPGDRYKSTSFDGGLIRGGAALSAERGIEDTIRLGKFQTSGKGFLFTGKQALLQSRNQKSVLNKETSEVDNVFNPLTGLYDPKSVLKDAISLNTTGFKHFARHLGGDNKNQYLEFIKENGDKFGTKYSDVQDAVTLFNTKGTKKLQVDYYDKVADNEDGSGLPKDFIKFRIRDIVNGKWIIFPALLTGGITDSSAAQYEKIGYVGRPDSVHIYKDMSRSFTVAFKVVATNPKEIPLMWKKIDRLKGLTQPKFKPFLNSGTTKDVPTRPSAPLIHLTIGDLYKKIHGYFDNVTVTIPESTTWELEDGRQLPLLCDVSCQFTWIGNVTPTMDSPNFGGQVGDKKDLFTIEKPEPNAAGTGA